MRNYLKIFGMYEQKNKTEFRVLNPDNNEDIFTWKEYMNKDSPPRMNSHENYEIPLHIQDSALRGT